MKKKFITITIIIVSLIILGIIANYLDSGRVTTNHEPKFCLKIISNNGEKVTYWGLGYKVIRYVNISPSEPYQNNIGVKMGSWFMKYDLPIDSNVDYSQDTITNLDDFYNLKLTKEKNIKNLTKNYSIDDAIKDGCFVIDHAKVYNDNLYTLFMDNYNHKKTSFMRIVTPTIEGDPILYDVVYFEKNNKLYLVIDNTRDNFTTKENQTITMHEYNQIGNYQSEGNEYLVLYNEEITEESFNKNQAFILAKIN